MLEYVKVIISCWISIGSIQGKVRLVIFLIFRWAPNWRLKKQDIATFSFSLLWAISVDKLLCQYLFTKLWVFLIRHGWWDTIHLKKEEHRCYILNILIINFTCTPRIDLSVFRDNVRTLPPLDPWSSRPHLKHNKKEEFQGQLVILLSVNFNIRHKKFLKHNLNWELKKTLKEVP